MTIREKVARAVAFSDPTITPKGHKELSWPYDWSDSEVADHVVVTTAAITAFLEAAAEDGWHMCRDEPTGDMVREAFLVNPMARRFNCSAGYRAMLAATPEFKWDK